MTNIDAGVHFNRNVRELNVWILYFFLNTRIYVGNKFRLLLPARFKFIYSTDLLVVLKLILVYYLTKARVSSDVMKNNHVTLGSIVVYVRFSYRTRILTH